MEAPLRISMSKIFILYIMEKLTISNLHMSSMVRDVYFSLQQILALIKKLILIVRYLSHTNPSVSFG